MKKIPTPELEVARIIQGSFKSPRGAMYGAFDMAPLRIISSGHASSDTCRWEHVSVSTEDRCPTWNEMNFIKNLFWDSKECVLQFHPPQQHYVNVHPYCLHLWKPPYPISLPPKELLA